MASVRIPDSQINDQLLLLQLKLVEKKYGSYASWFCTAIKKKPMQHVELRAWVIVLLILLWIERIVEHLKALFFVRATTEVARTKKPLLS